MSRMVQAIAHFALGMVSIVSGAAAESMQLAVNGQARAFLFERPSAQGPHPTIIMLHGMGSNPAREAQLSGLGQLAPRRGFAAVFPEGQGSRWHYIPPGRESTQSKQQGGAPDDVAFLKAVVADLVRRGIADPNRIYLAGQSAGGMMTLRMACMGDATFAAIGLLIASMPEPTGADCRLPKPLPVLMMNGTADNIVPYGGGPVSTPDGKIRSAFRVWPAERLVGFFRQHNGCSEPAEKSVLPEQNPHKVEIERSTKCPGGPVDYYRIVGGGHDPRPRALNASQLLVDFFRDKARAVRHPVVAETFNRIMYRRLDGTTVVTGDVRRTAANAWLETNTPGQQVDLPHDQAKQLRDCALRHQPRHLRQNGSACQKDAGAERNNTGLGSARRHRWDRETIVAGRQLASGDPRRCHESLEGGAQGGVFRCASGMR